MRPHDIRGYLYDILQASALLDEFTAGMSLDEYVLDAKACSAVERQFENIGEAVNPALRLRPQLATDVSGAHRIVSFRNRLIHGYALVANDIVWSVLHDDLPLLRRQVEHALHEEEEVGA